MIDESKLIIASLFLPLTVSDSMNSPRARVAVKGPFVFKKSNLGNIGLQNAVKVSSFDALWVGCLSLSNSYDVQQQNLLSLLLKNHSMAPVFPSDLELDGHYNQFCKQVLYLLFNLDGNHFTTNSKTTQNQSLSKIVLGNITLLSTSYLQTKSSKTINKYIILT